jgi:hypothetical protein
LLSPDATCRTAYLVSRCTTPGWLIAARSRLLAIPQAQAVLLLSLDCPARDALARGGRKLQKVLAQERGVAGIWAVRQDRVAEVFPRPEHFSPAGASPSWIRGREVEEFERAREGVIPSVDATGLVRSQGPVDFAADVGKLLDD